MEFDEGLHTGWNLVKQGLRTRWNLMNQVRSLQAGLETRSPRVELFETILQEGLCYRVHHRYVIEPIIPTQRMEFGETGLPHQMEFDATGA
jgi:hypothetical protein